MSKSGKILRKFRVRQGISQAQLAEQVEVDTSYISKLENGSRLIPSRNLMISIAKVLNLSIQEMDLWFFSAGYASPRVQREVQSEISKLVDG